MEFDAASFVGEVIRFVAEPYESGTIRVTACARADESHARVCGVVVEGQRTSRLFHAQSHRSIAGETVNLRVPIFSLMRERFAYYVYPVG